MSRVEAVKRHKGHDVTCERCSLIAIDFIDYVGALKNNRPGLYDGNKCWCTLPTEFFCSDCKEKFSHA